MCSRTWYFRDILARLGRIICVLYGGVSCDKRVPAVWPWRTGHGAEPQAREKSRANFRQGWLMGKKQGKNFRQGWLMGKKQGKLSAGLVDGGGGCRERIALQNTSCIILFEAPPNE